MIAYNKEWLNNEEALAQIENALAENCISPEEKVAGAAQYPSGFYTPNIFVRIGLFLLSLVIILFSFGLLALLFLTSINEIEKAIAVLCIIFGFICYTALEYFVNTKNHYQSGVDDALLWAAPGFILTGLNLLYNIGPLNNAILILILAIFLTLRFADRLMAIIATVALLAVLFFSFVLMGEVAKNILPFVLMFTSATIYFISKKLAALPALVNYEKCFTVTGILGLVAVFISGNYYVVREASIEFFNLQLSATERIPFGWLFWIFTVAIPLLYLVWGVFKKDAILIRTGLLLVAVMVFTVRYYNYAMPVEMLMIIGGLLLTAIAFLFIKYLKVPKAGFTSDAISNSNNGLNIEALVIAETLSAQPDVDTGTRFGGGSFGGGGASGEF